MYICLFQQHALSARCAVLSELLLCASRVPQVDDLLSITRVNYSRCAGWLDGYITQLTTAMSNIPAHDVSGEAVAGFLTDIGVASEQTMTFAAPVSTTVIGSYPLQVVAGSRLVVDVAVEIPRTSLVLKAQLNYRCMGPHGQAGGILGCVLTCFGDVASHPITVVTAVCILAVTHNNCAFDRWCCMTISQFGNICFQAVPIPRWLLRVTESSLGVVQQVPCACCYVPVCPSQAPVKTVAL